MTDTISLALIAVLIDTERGATTLSAEVPAHEIDVLRVVHPGRVREAGDTGDEIELNISADAEFARLQRKYHRTNAPDPVRFAYHGGASSLKAFGFELGRGGDEEAPQAMVVKHPKPKKAAKAKSE